MEKILILLLSVAFQNALLAQITTKTIDLSAYKVKSDREYVVADKHDDSMYLFFQKDKSAFGEPKMSVIQIDSNAKIFQNKDLEKSFPRLNALITTLSNDNGLNYIYRTNKNGLSEKPEGVQLIRNIRLDKKTLSQTDKTLFEVNYPSEEIISSINTDTIQYMMTFEKKANKVTFYGFDADTLRFQKAYSLPKMDKKKFYEKVFDNTVEGKNFADMVNKGKLFLKENTFHLLIDHDECQFYMPFNLNQDSTYIKELPLAIKSAVSLSATPDRKTTGQIMDNKIFQLHKLENVLCLGVYDLASLKRIALVEYKKGDTTTTKNSPFYLDDRVINKKNEIKNSNYFFNSLLMPLLAIEVVDKVDTYEIKMGGSNTIQSSNNMDFLMQNMMFQRQMNLNMQSINPPPPIRAGGFRSLEVQPYLFIEGEVREVYFYLKLKKSDLSFAEETISPNMRELDKLRKILIENEQSLTPDFKFKDRDGFGYYDKTEKKFILNIED